MNLVAVLSVYNEGKNLTEIIQQIHPFVDKILVIDGRYKDFPIMKDDSIEQIDNLLSTIRRGYSHVILYNRSKPWENEMEKRSVMFDYGTFGDWFLILDGDERIRHPANWAALRHFLEHEVDPETIIVGLMLYDYKTGLKYYVSKLVKYIPTAKYEGNHYTLAYGDYDDQGNRVYHKYYDMVNDGSLREDVDFVEIDHLNRKKLDPIRNDLRKEYYLRARSIEEPNLYKVGENRYRRKIERFSMEPIDEETKEAIMKEMKDWT